MTGWKRTLAYWGKITEKQFLNQVIALVVINVLCAGEIDTFADYTLMILCTGMITLAHWNIRVLIPQAISMGATRRECLVGTQIFYHLFMLQGIIMEVVVMRYVSGLFQNSPQEVLLFMIAISLFVCALGNAVVAIILKTEGNRMQAVFIVVLIIVACIVILISMVAQYICIPYLGEISIGVILVSVVWDICMLMYNKKAIMKYEVRL